MNRCRRNNPVRQMVSSYKQQLSSRMILVQYKGSTALPQRYHQGESRNEYMAWMAYLAKEFGSTNWISTLDIVQDEENLLKLRNPLEDGDGLSMADLEGVLAWIRQGKCRCVAFDSLTPLTMYHGFATMFRFLSHLKRDLILLIPVDQNLIYPQQQMALEDVSHASLYLQQGILLRKGGREGSNVLRNEFSWHIGPEGEPLIEDKQTAAAPPPPPQMAAAEVAKGNKVVLKHEEDSAEKSKPLIYMQDDDPEFDDLDPEDPDDDDLDI